jgi:hypothetical protein
VGPYIGKKHLKAVARTILLSRINPSQKQHTRTEEGIKIAPGAAGWADKHTWLMCSHGRSCSAEGTARKPLRSGAGKNRK